MKSYFDFYESASWIGTKNQVADFMKSIEEKDFEDWTIVRKSERRWAAFQGSATSLIPNDEPTYTVEEFLKL
jgi:hypothetical protein